MAHSGGYDITISDPRSRVIQIQGPASMDIMRAASAGQIDAGMRYFRSGFFNLGGQQLYVSRTLFIPSFYYQMTPKIPLNTRCSISISKNLSINGRTRSSDQLGIWSYNINP